MSLSPQSSSRPLDPTANDLGIIVVGQVIVLMSEINIGAVAWYVLDAQVVRVGESPLPVVVLTQAIDHIKGKLHWNIITLYPRIITGASADICVPRAHWRTGGIQAHHEIQTVRRCVKQRPCDR